MARKQEQASKNNSSLEFKPMATFWFTVAEPPSPPINPLQSLQKYLMRLTSRCVPNFYCLAFLVVSDCQILMPSCINHFQRRQLSFLQHKKRKWKNVSEVFIYQKRKTSFCNWERERRKKLFRRTRMKKVWNKEIVFWKTKERGKKWAACFVKKERRVSIHPRQLKLDNKHLYSETFLIQRVFPSSVGVKLSQDGSP